MCNPALEAKLKTAVAINSSLVPVKLCNKFKKAAEELYVKNHMVKQYRNVQLFFRVKTRP